MDTSFAAFLALSAVVIATPGPDTALTIRNTLAGGRRAGIGTALGVALGQLVWAGCTSLGVVAVVLASEPVFHALRLLGAAYLVWLGVQSLRDALARRVAGEVAAPDTARLSAGRGLLQGVVNDLANPKMAIFFASVLPQFAPAGEGMLSRLLLLGLVFSAMTFAWLALYATTLAALGTAFRRSALRRALDGIAGATLVALGLRVAVSDR